MTIDTCSHCDEPVDTDKDHFDCYPYASESLASAAWFDVCTCERCQAGAYEGYQEDLVEMRP